MFMKEQNTHHTAFEQAKKKKSFLFYLDVTERHFCYVTSYFFVVTSMDIVTFQITVTFHCKRTITVEKKGNRFFLNQYGSKVTLPLYKSNVPAPSTFSKKVKITVLCAELC